MASLEDSIRSLYPEISKLRELSGSPGLSLGVLHEGKITHTAHFGQKDINNPIPPDDNTIYHVASLTKVLTAAAVASLVDEGLLEWNLPIIHYLPEFEQRRDDLGQKCTLIDLLSNRSGIAMANALWGQKHGEFLLSKSQVVQTACHIEAVKPFRSSFVYSQWNYALATAIVERVTNETFGTYVRRKFLVPLGMSRTNFMRPDEKEDNVATPYAIDDDMNPVRVRNLNMTDDTGFAGGYAMRTTINDLLTLYQSLLHAYAHQSDNNVQSTEGSPFKNVKAIFSPYIGVGTSTIDNTAYCLGLYRTRLPNNLSISSINNLLLGPQRLPRIGINSTGLEIFHHTGNVPGYFASAFLIPSTKSAVVMLTNSLSFVDPTNLVAQVVLSQILNEQPPQNLFKLCDLARSASMASYKALNVQLGKHKTDKPPEYPLVAYEGEYINEAGTFVIAIPQMEKGLIMKMQHMPLTSYELLPYDGNTFYWLANRNAEIAQSMCPIPSTGYHKIVFGTDQKHGIDRLIWKHDPYARPEVFGKRRVTGTLELGKL
ncbi:MAG: hypothetical protein Q9221_003613 [Calogaya cf. arnoldii]